MSYPRDQSSSWTNVATAASSTSVESHSVENIPWKDLETHNGQIRYLTNHTDFAPFTCFSPVAITSYDVLCEFAAKLACPHNSPLFSPPSELSASGSSPSPPTPRESSPPPPDTGSGVPEASDVEPEVTRGSEPVTQSRPEHESPQRNTPFVVTNKPTFTSAPPALTGIGHPSRMTSNFSSLPLNLLYTFPYYRNRVRGSCSLPNP